VEVVFHPKTAIDCSVNVVSGDGSGSSSHNISSDRRDARLRYDRSSRSIVSRELSMQGHGEHMSSSENSLTATPKKMGRLDTTSTLNVLISVMTLLCVSLVVL